MAKKSFTYYISGSVSKEMERNGFISVWMKFNKAAYRLEQRTGCGTINPMHLCNADWSWVRCTVVCVWNLLRKCNAIYMLDDYKESRGAKIELWLAKRMNYKIEFEE